MITSIHLPLLVSLLLAAISPILAARLSPARAATALVAAAAAAAVASTTWALVLLAATVAPTPPVGHGPSIDPLPIAIALTIAVGAAAATVRVVAALRRRRRVTRALRALCETCGVDGQELVVAPIADPHAFAVPGRRGRGASGSGRILVTAGMLRVLDSAGRRALLAHERAHLAGRHHRKRALVEIAAALNPLLVPARVAVAYLVERAADEDAAIAIGDRRAAADALATAALAGTTGSGPVRSPPHDAALAYSSLGVARRVAALHADPLPERRLPLVLLLALAVLTATEAVHTLAAFSVAELLAHVLPPGS